MLKGLDVSIREGEVVTVIGPSGSGKSTFLRCLNKLEEPTSGRIVFEGQDLTDPKTDIDVVRQHIGMVFQHFNLFPHMTVAENIMLAPVQLKRMSKAEARDRATRAARTGSSSPRRWTPDRHSSPAGRSSASRSRGRWRCSRT